MPDAKDLLTTKEAAELVGVHPATIRRVIRLGYLKKAKDEPILVWRKDVLAWQSSDFRIKGPPRGTKYGKQRNPRQSKKEKAIIG